MKSLGCLTGCALALACAREGKGVVNDTRSQGVQLAKLQRLVEVDGLSA